MILLYRDAMYSGIAKGTVGLILGLAIIYWKLVTSLYSWATEIRLLAAISLGRSTCVMCFLNKNP